MKPTNEDVALLKRYAETKDAEAFSALVGRYQGFVYGICLRVLANAADAEDVAQECFLRLIRNSDSVRYSLGGWLHHCATDMSTNEKRRQAARKRREELSVEMNSKSGSDPTWHELSPHVDDAVDGLPDELRIVIVEHFFQRRTQAEIAKELGVSAMTVSRRVESGIEELRKELKKAGVIVSAALLASLVAEHAVVAAPATLTVALGKMAIAGVNSGAAAGWTGTGVAAGAMTTAAKMKIAAVVVAAAALAGGGVVANRMAKKPAEQAGAAAAGDGKAEAAVEPATDRPSELLSSLGKLWLEIDKYPGSTPPDEEKFSQLREAKEAEHRKTIDGLVADGAIDENAAKVLKQAFHYVSRETRYRVGLVKRRITKALAVGLDAQKNLLEALASLAERAASSKPALVEVEGTHTQIVRDLYVIIRMGRDSREDPALPGMLSKAYHQGKEFDEPIPEQYARAARILIEAVAPGYEKQSVAEKTQTAKADEGQIDELPWGESIDGVQCRLRADKRVWRVGEVPKPKAEVRNLGKRNFDFLKSEAHFEVQYDGRWYVHGAGEILSGNKLFGPGKRYEGISIGLGNYWCGKEDVKKRLQLAPGKHIVRVALDDALVPKPAGKMIRVVSNPVEIELIPAKALGE